VQTDSHHNDNINHHFTVYTAVASLGLVSPAGRQLMVSPLFFLKKNWRLFKVITGSVLQCIYFLLKNVRLFFSFFGHHCRFY